MKDQNENNFEDGNYRKSYELWKMYLREIEMSRKNYNGKKASFKDIKKRIKKNFSVKSWSREQYNDRRTNTEEGTTIRKKRLSKED